MFYELLQGLFILLLAPIMIVSTLILYGIYKRINPQTPRLKIPTPKIMEEKEKNKLRKQVKTLDVKEVVLLVRNGEIIERVKAYLTDQGEVLDKKKQRLWKIEPEHLKLYVLREKNRAKPMLIVDANTQAIYHFENPVNDIKEMKKLRLHPAILNPKTLYTYIASGSIKKLLGKITVSTAEKVLYIIVGAFIIYLMQFFLLPMIGFKIIIAPVR